MQKQYFGKMEYRKDFINGYSPKSLMSRISLLLVLLFVPVVLLGQERINREKLKFVKISKPLEKAKGWEYNATRGEWVSYNNVISQNKGKLNSRTMMSSNSQNFIKIQTKSVTYKGADYFVLIINKWNGEYVSINIHELEWRKYRQTFGYIFSKEEYQKLNNIENLIELKTKYMVSIDIFPITKPYSETEFLDLIQTELETGKSENSTVYIFPVLKSTKGDIRFYLPDSFSKDAYDFDKKYFETSLKSFSRIIIK
jgi:hypothetical protein